MMSGCTRIEWLSVRDKQLSADFYDAIGATRADHMIVRRLQGQVLRELAHGAPLDLSRTGTPA